jgi:hypothetical protein
MRAFQLRNPAFGLLKSHLPCGSTPVTELDTKYQYTIQNPYHQSASAAQTAQFKRLYQK